MSRKKVSLPRVILLALLCICAPHICGGAQAQTKNFDVPSQSAETGVALFAQQADVQILISAHDATGKRTHRLAGGYGVPEGLALLLKGTGLVAKETGPQTYTVVPSTHPTRTAAAEQIKSTAASRAEKAAEAIGEITVTARKRQESLLDVPVVATVIPQTQLERQQTIDLKDVSKFVPGLSLSQTLGISGIQVSLRGIGTSAQNVAIDASVALNIDGMQITQGIAYSSAMFDLQQIEVLKGPQALFFGKNSPGGVISLRTADPKDRLEVMGSYGYEAVAAAHRVQAVLSGPFSNSLRLRLAAQYSSEKGYFRSEGIAAPGLGGMTPRHRNGPGGEAYVVRGTATWEPSEEFRARLKVNLTNDRLTEGVSLQRTSCPDGTGAVPPRNIPFLGQEDCIRNRVSNSVDFDPAAFPGLIDKTGISANRTNQKFGTIELDYKPTPDIILTSVTGYYRLVFRSQQSPVTAPAGPTFASIVNPVTRRDITEELRAHSDFAGPLNFTLGGYYQSGRLFLHTSLAGNTAIGLAPYISNHEQTMNVEAISAFGQIRWKFVPRIEVAAGARWTHEARDLTVWNLVTGTNVPFPTARPKISSDNISPEVTVSYKPRDGVTTFVSYKKAYKSGSFSTPPPSGVLPDNSFGDEKIEGWEVGVKAQLAGRRLFTELAFYDYHYKGLQVGTTATIVNGVPINRTINSGGALIYGVDFNATYFPPHVEGLRLQTAVVWNHARFKTLENVPCWGGQSIAEGCTQSFNPVTRLFTGQNMSGQPLLRAPEWQVNFGFDYEMQLGEDWTLTIANMNQYSSRYLANLGLRQDFFQPPYLKSDVSVALKEPDGRWEVALIGKNLSDVLTTGNCSNSNSANGTILGGQITGGTGRGPAGIDELACYMNRGREVWLRVTVRPFN